MRVVCGIDDTPDNGYVLEHAMALSEELGAELVVVTVGESARPSGNGPALPFDPGTYRSGALEDAASTLQQHAAAALAAGARGRVEIGDPAARLAEVAMDENASLVVIGWRRRRLRRSGGLHSRLLRRCRCPVVVVGPGAADGNP